MPNDPTEIPEPSEALSSANVPAQGDEATTTESTAPIGEDGSVTVTPVAPREDGPTPDLEVHQAPIDADGPDTGVAAGDIGSSNEHSAPSETDELTAGAASASANEAATNAEPPNAAPALRSVPASNARSLLSPIVPLAFQSILGPRPCCAGEDPAAYDLLFETIAEPWQPQRFDEFRLVKVIADCEWDMLRYGRATTFTFNAVIARTLLARIVDRLCEQKLTKQEKHGYVLLQRDPSPEQEISQRTYRVCRRTALAAVSGDQAAIAEVERLLGPGSVVLDVFAADEFEASLDKKAQIERLIQAELSKQNAASNALERLVSKRLMRQPAEETRRSEASGALPNSRIQSTPADVTVPTDVAADDVRQNQSESGAK
jgi:hypothetical protein